MINKIIDKYNINEPRYTRSLTKSFPQSKRNRETELIYLNKVNAFSLLKNYQIDYLYRSIKSVEFTRGHLIFQEGQKYDAIYVIKQGEIEIFKKEPINHQIQQHDQLNKKNMVCSHFAELQVIKVQDYKRILDMEPQIKLQQQESDNMDDFEVITKYQLPSLYDSVKNLQTQKQDIQYLKKIRNGITYLLPQSQRIYIMKNFYIDQSLEEIYKKSVILHEKMLPYYQQVDLHNPLIKGQEVINDRLLLNKVLQKEYTIKIPKQQSKKIKLMNQSFISSANSPMSRKLQLVFQKDKKLKQNLSINDVTHREKKDQDYIRYVPQFFFI
ncbi:unnamed protein product [Paramecium sonneborni]|uniref:Cyclic nucleotide-binding domain-containing protein n=1 Tax=Paramecium sonneborni TaxID=65129 RepID=A0A8S1JZL3_9CILI|nr:unnamed protein product [Paramecium sonneborni]